MLDFKKFVLHPFLFAVLPVIFLFSQNIEQVGVTDLIFPLLIVVISSIMIWLLLYILLKNSIKAGMIVSLSFMSFFSFGHVHTLLDGVYIADIDIGQLRYVVFLFLVVFVTSVTFFVITKRKLDSANIIANAIAIALVVMSFGNIGTYYIQQDFIENDILTSVNDQKTLSVLETSPNIYFLLFDGYPRADNLQKFYDFDNSDLIDYLTEQDFYVAHQSTTNYPRTYLSLSSTLNMQYLNHITEKLGEDSMDRNQIKRMISNNEVMEKFKSLGYTIINFDSVLSSANDIDIVDHQLCRINKYIDNEFFMMLIGSSVLKIVYQDILDTGRDQMLCVFETIPNLHDDLPEPFFVYAHVLLPHPPFVFGPNGEEVRPETLELGDKGTWKDKENFINFLQFGNKKIKEIVNIILTESDSPSIIIIMGDHGTEQTYDLGDELTDITISERMPILNAYYFPDSNYDVLYDTITPVNSFRIIFNEYFDGTYEILPDRNYWSDDAKPNKLIDVTEIVINNKN